jgi:hypothetical protein
MTAIGIDGYALGSYVTIAGSTERHQVRGRTIEEAPRYDLMAPDRRIVCNVPASFITGHADEPLLRIGQNR